MVEEQQSFFETKEQLLKDTSDCHINTFHQTPNNQMFSSIKQRIKTREPSSIPVINVSSHLRKVCSVYIEKGRFHSTASKLTKTKVKCTRLARELEILQNRFKVV